MPYIKQNSIAVLLGYVFMFLGLAFALASLFFFPSTIFIVLLAGGLVVAVFAVVGGRMSLECSDCATRINHREVRICPGCRQQFDDEES
jgi:hypothetical protein